MCHLDLTADGPFVGRSSRDGVSFDFIERVHTYLSEYCWRQVRIPVFNVAVEEEEEEKDFFAIVGRDGPVLIRLTCGRWFHVGIVLMRLFHQSARMLDTSVVSSKAGVSFQ